MAFNVEVRFTGICAFVPDRAFNMTPTKVCAVMPHAFFEDILRPTDAVDGTRLRRHRAMVRFPLRNVPGMSGDKTGAEVFRYVEKQRLTFDAPGAAPLTIGTLSNVINISAVAPGFDQVNPDCLKPPIVNPSPAAQVLFKVGHLTQGPLHAQVWNFTPSVLSPRTVSTQLVNEVVLTMNSVTSFKILYQALETGHRSEQELTANAGDTIVITIAHLCQDNPLQWQTANFPAVNDDDAKWYFNLLSLTDQARLNSKLDFNELPIPRPDSSGGRGINCSPAVMAPGTITE